MSKKPKLTPWFDGNTPPARDGVYQLNGDASGPFAKRESGVWFIHCETPAEAARERLQSLFQDGERGNDCWRWRGLAEKPQ